MRQSHQGHQIEAQQPTQYRPATLAGTSSSSNLSAQMQSHQYQMQLNNFLNARRSSTGTTSAIEQAQG